MRRMVFASTAAVAFVCAIASPAAAHVTVDPPSAPKGATVKLSFLVPNEESRARVTRVQIVFPSPPETPIAGVSVGQKPGWKATVIKKHLAKPLVTDDGTIADVVGEIDWIASTTDAAVKPGEFGEFTIDADGLPTNESQVVFRAVQTYSNGDKTRWIDPVTPNGPPADHPTPILELTNPGSGASATPTTSAPTNSTTLLSTTTKDNSARALGVIGIALGAVALVGATGALMRRRRAAP